MKRHLVVVMLATALLASGSRTAAAQEPTPKPSVQPAPAPQPVNSLFKTERIPLELQVVVARYQGEKKVSSQPYAVSVNANEPSFSRLRMGAKVPVPSIMAPKGNPAGITGPMPGPVNYQDVGTNIDARAMELDAGRYDVSISIEDTSVYSNVQDPSTPTAGDMPVFRTFKSSNTLVLRDGQTRQFTAAADRISGEVVKVDVTLKVVK